MFRNIKRTNQIARLVSVNSKAQTLRALNSKNTFETSGLSKSDKNAIFNKMRIDQYIMSIESANMRSFSSQQPRKDFSSENEKSKDAKNAYEDEFADLLNQGKVSEKQ